MVLFFKGFHNKLLQTEIYPLMMARNLKSRAILFLKALEEDPPYLSLVPSGGASIP